jgi:hypothetical protein
MGREGNAGGSDGAKKLGGDGTSANDGGRRDKVSYMAPQNTTHSIPGHAYAQEEPVRGGGEGSGFKRQAILPSTTFWLRWVGMSPPTRWLAWSFDEEPSASR